MKDVLLDTTYAEVSQWPGVTVEVKITKSNHRAALLTYRGTTRQVFFALTTSDPKRGPKNHRSQIRRTLIEMGAKRS